MPRINSLVTGEDAEVHNRSGGDLKAVDSNENNDYKESAPAKPSPKRGHSGNRSKLNSLECEEDRMHSRIRNS